MSEILASRGRYSAYKLVLFQTVIAGLFSFLFFIIWGVQSGVSALAGTIIAVLPNFVFATLAFSHAGASNSAKVIKSFYWGEAMKLLLTVVLFSLVFNSINIAFMPLFICYLLALLVHWTAPLYFKQK